MKLRVVAVVLVSAILGGGALAARDLISDGSGGGWSHETGGAWDAERMLIAAFDRGRPNLTLVVEAAEGDVDSPDVTAAVGELTGALDERGDITQVESYWSLGRPDWLRSDDGASALLMARIPGASGNFADRVDALAPLLRQTPDAIEVTVGGEAALHRDIAVAMRGVVVPMGLTALVGLALVLLVTRSVAVTVLWALTSLLAVAGSLIGLGVVSRFREVPLLSVMLGIALAWGIASGGGFLIARRFLAEHAAGAGPPQAVVATIGTAGRTVAIAAGVAAAGGFALWLMPTTLLRSSGYAFGIAGVAAGIAAVPVLGTLLAMTGSRLFQSGAGSAASLTPRSRLDPVSTVFRNNPLITLMIATVVLGSVLFAGFQVSLGEPGPETVAADASSRRVAQTIAARYPADDAGAPFVVARGLVQFSEADEQAAAYGLALSTIPGVVRVDTAAGSYADGVSIEVPAAVSSIHGTDNGLWYRVPVAGSPTGRIADEVVRVIDATPRPFRVQLGGLAAREADTVGAVEARTIVYLLAAVLGAVLLLAWLLRSTSAALRATASIVLVTAAAAAVVRWGFADGWLSPLLGFVSGGSLEAVSPTLAWATGFAVGGVSLLFGWGAVREMNDATHGEDGSAALALASTSARHLEATALVALPFAPFVIAEWRTAQVVGVAALATGVFAATVGRFVLLPAFASVAGTRLWPTDARGDQRRVYPTTPVARSTVEASKAAGTVLQEPYPDPEPADIEPVQAVVTPEPHRVVEDAPFGDPIGAGPRDGDAEPDVDVNPVSEIDPGDGPAPAATTEVEPVGDVEPESVVVDEPGTEPVDEVVPESVVVDEPGTEPVDEVVPESVVVDEPGSEPVDEVVPESVVVDQPGTEPVDEVVPESASAEPVAPPGEPAPVSGGAVPAGAPPAGEADTPHLAVASTLQAIDVSGSVDRRREVGDPSSAVDVVLLTESVIASLDPSTPFTTEIGRGFVANPSNNLSRVMEAILRDASTRGGDEVLVYGHASRGRYRWMVVDSGPRADDPDRARTLAEAQRFIRRVGGVVECRPQGDFTVFVVEIPMAS